MSQKRQFEGADTESGTLYVVATPIGNLDDVSARALQVLEAVDVIACEDTRVTRKLLSAKGISTPTMAYHAHSGSDVQAKLLTRLEQGARLALVSDAGTPLISDPGAELVQATIDRGISVVPIPGPSALLAAVVGSGLPPQPLLFLGFLPRADRGRREILGPLRQAPYTLVIYEAPSRVVGTLHALARSLGDRPACVARELTKRYETFVRGRLSTLADRMQAEPPQGEVVIVVGPGTPEQTNADADEIEATARRWLAEGQAPAEVARAIAGAFGMTKRQAYKVVVSLRRDDAEQDDVEPQPD